jgi:hypothetical protein
LKSEFEFEVPAGRFLMLSAALVMLAVYANSGVIQWGDNGMFLREASTQPLFSPDLSEMSHPLFHLVSVVVYRLAGAHGVAWLNGALMPVIGALAFVLARRTGAARGVAMASATAVLATHCLLWVCTKVEVYALHLTLILACWIVFLDGVHKGWGALRMLLLGLLAGMALSVHQLTLIVLAPMAAVLPWQARWRVGWGVLGFVVGLFACMPGFVHLHGMGMSTFDIIHRFLTGGGARQADDWESMFLRIDHLLAKPHLVAAVLVSLVGAGGVGLLAWPRSLTARMMWAGAALNLLFAITYDVPDRFSFFLPGAALFAILGVRAMAERTTGWFRRDRLLAMILVPVVAGHVVPLFASDLLMKLPRVKSPAPGFNQLTYYFSPLVPDRAAERFVKRFEQVVPVGSVVYADFLTENALVSGQGVGQFLGREVRPCSTFDPHAKVGGPVFLVQPLECDQPMRYVQTQLPLGYRLALPGPAKP